MIRALFVALALSLLSACATLFAPNKPAYVLNPEQHVALDARRAALAALHEWELAGRISVRKGDEIWAGQLNWHEQSGEYQVQFNAPTGQGALRLSGGPNGVELHLVDGSRVQADDADTLIREQTGWNLPLNGMRQWILGLPTPAPVEGLSLDEEGKPLWIEQAGWSIQYLRYNQLLPAKIDMRHEDMRIRLVVHRWTTQD